jgi:hypothetical protein
VHNGRNHGGAGEPEQRRQKAPGERVRREIRRRHRHRARRPRRDDAPGAHDSRPARHGRPEVRGDEVAPGRSAHNEPAGADVDRVLPRRLEDRVVVTQFPVDDDRQAAGDLDDPQPSVSAHLELEVERLDPLVGAVHRGVRAAADDVRSGSEAHRRAGCRPRHPRGDPRPVGTRCRRGSGRHVVVDHTSIDGRRQRRSGKQRAGAHDPLVLLRGKLRASWRTERPRTACEQARRSCGEVLADV